VQSDLRGCGWITAIRQSIVNNPDQGDPNDLDAGKWWDFGCAPDVVLCSLIQSHTGMAKPVHACPKCSAEVREGWRACPFCAAPLGELSEGPTLSMPGARSAQTSSDSLDEGRFPAGTILSERYRILGLLGRGGMGEVYRANDLKLGQLVALKFLPESMARNSDRIARFHAEVRIARKVSHPNVCRVYDIGEIDGSVFLSMEYIDGEDLRSLLRRIGRLPADKALEIAHRLCAGLAAAHDKGVLHRDLKPANLMLDGRGQVLIADFGLAGMADQLHNRRGREGTAAYMAPEQLAGREVSVRSDIYSLGLILHEMFTGKRPDEVASNPTLLMKDLDPVVERVILGCLQAEPRNRPPSALAVARALPGGDPLAAALAAGDTPSPDMVAAAGDTERISVRTAGVALGAVLAGLVVVAMLGTKTNVLQQTPFDKSPGVLEEKARDLIHSFGYNDAPADRAYGFSYDAEFQRYGEERKDATVYRALLIKGRPALIRFWYRQSPEYLTDPPRRNIVSLGSPPPIRSGMVSVSLSPQGRLIELTAVPPQVEKPATVPATSGWGALFTAAALDITRFTPVNPEWLPLVSFDARAAWTGVYPDTDLPLRIEAASWRGRPVNFQMIGPWTKPLRMQPVYRTGMEGKAMTGAFLILAALAYFLAWRHFRLRRGDRRGAFRLAVIVFSVGMMEWLCAANHVPDLGESAGLSFALSWALLSAALFWALYMALEPYVRRHWPQGMIAWSRLLGGGVRDPVVGGDLLIGLAFGVGLVVFFRFRNLVLEVVTLPAGLRVNLDSVVTARHAARVMLSALVGIGVQALLLLFLFFLLRALFRNQWIAAVAFTVLVVLVTPANPVNHPLIGAALNATGAALVIFISIRFGLLAVMAALFALSVLVAFPATTDLSTWYAGSTLFAYATVLALAGYAFQTAVAGRPLFKAAFLDGN
jgi:serine/threonine protein kinase